MYIYIYIHVYISTNRDNCAALAVGRDSGTQGHLRTLVNGCTD